MADESHRLKRESDQLIWALRRVGELEREKRREPIGSPRFEALATAISQLSRDVMYRAIEEERIGRDAAPTDETIDDVATGEDPGRHS